MSLVSPFRVTRQTVSVSVETEQLSVKGWTEIEIHATTPNPPQAIFLNARQMKISKVQINGTDSPFQYVDSHAALLFSTSQLVRDAAHYATVAQIVAESPDLFIPYSGEYPVSLHIDFEVNEGCTSIVCDQGVVVTDNRVDGPSGWFPCMDTLGQRTMFALSVTHSQGLVCIGPGEATFGPGQQPRTNVTMFKIGYPVQAFAIGFALGPFMQQAINGMKSCFMYYTSATDIETFKDTMKPVPDLQRAICTKFPFLGDPSEVATSFVSLPFIAEYMVWPNVIFIPNSMFSPTGNLNVVMTVVPQLIEAMIALFVLFLFPVADHRDRWIQVGLCALFADLIASQYFSQSFRLERRWKDLNWLMKEDIHPSIVLRALDPVTGECFRDKFLRTKAKLLMNMIVTSLRSADTRLVMLMTPLVKQSQDPKSGFVTEKFQADLIRFCPSINFKAFQKQWLTANGFPIFTYNFTNDVRHNNLKLVLAQTPSAKTVVPFFTGQMVIELQDLDQPYQFPYSIENKLQIQPMQYFAHRKKTKAKDFLFENGQRMKVPVHHAVMWIIIDEPMSWICRVRPRLPEFMLLYQLQLLRNVFAQHEAVSSLEDFKDSERTIEKLKEMLENNALFFGVRQHVARALARFANEQSEFKHMTILLDWYRSNFFYPVQQGQKPRVKPHDFQDTKNHFVQLEVIKALSIIRDSRNFTPNEVVEFLFTIMENANNNSNSYNDDYYNAEVELAYGRIRPETDNPYVSASNIIQGKLSVHATVPSVNNIISSAGYLALTAISLKTTTVRPNKRDMRAVVLESSPYFEARASVFRDLLFLALYEIADVTFPELIADIRTLAVKGSREMAALCLRELHRFVNNPVHVSDEDRFETYLLAIPDEMNREALIKAITRGPEELSMAETLWELLTVHGQHHRLLRSEAYRAYQTLYGEKLPFPYAEKGRSQSQVELTAERSGGCVLQIDMPRVPQRVVQPSVPKETPPTPKKMIFKLTDSSMSKSQRGQLPRSESQYQVHPT